MGVIMSEPTDIYACCALYPDGYWTCNLPKGHSGDHEDRTPDGGTVRWKPALDAAATETGETATLRALLARAADACSKGSEFEGMCADCGMDPFSTHPDAPIGEHHGAHCVVREIRALLGEPAVAVAIPDGPSVPSRIPPRACGAKHEGFMCTRPAGHQGDHEAEDVLRQIVARWHEPEASPGTFAVIRYTGGGPDSAIYGPVEEAQWDFFSRHAKGWEEVCRGLPSFEMAQSIAWTLSSRPFSE